MRSAIHDCKVHIKLENLLKPSVPKLEPWVLRFAGMSPPALKDGIPAWTLIRDMPLSW